MRIYWMFLIVSLIIWRLCDTRYQIVEINGRYEKRASPFFAVLFGGLLVFFCGLRSGVADTGTYISIFRNIASNPSTFIWENINKGTGFYYLTMVYKWLISEDFHGWLFTICLISVIPIMHELRKHSCSFGFSIFLFIAATLFTYLVNGIRQFICVAILFACTDLIEQRKYIQYCIIVGLLTFIHSSAILMIPVALLSRSKPFGKTIWLLIGMGILVGTQYSFFSPAVETALEGTEYTQYIDIMENGQGANILRLFIAGVPPLLAWFKRRNIWDIDNGIINICVNMSVINAVLYFIAIFTSGLTIGRVAIYFELYNLLLLPWLIDNLFDKASARVLTALAVVFYAVFFYFQMDVTWRMVYQSDILHMYF